VVKGEDLIVFEVDNDDEEDEMENIIDAEDWLDDVTAEVWEDESNDSDEEWEDASEGDMDVDIPEASLDGIDDEVHPLVPVHASIDLEDPSSPKGIAPPTADTLEWGIKTEKCARFDILEVVPSDHPFKSDNVNTNQGREWMARIRKEHKILQSSLPGKRGFGVCAYTVEGILVRTYESRLDLMRVLILGPKNTPYENAPFLFDFSLADRFPTEPPEAFFHSWTPGGNGGRVNPNLYVYVTPYSVH
jgi:ubiquitin-conjugating enzyme E2 O